VIWTEVEVCVSIFCASATSLQPLVQRIAPRLLSNIPHSRNDSGIVERKALKRSSQVTRLDSQAGGHQDEGGLRLVDPKEMMASARMGGNEEVNNKNDSEEQLVELGELERVQYL
jgi:hypothetical protein